MFYYYRQNNSGGHWDHDERVRKYVIIEAEDYTVANALAVARAGIYFYGADHEGPDCPCCGDRWSELWGESDSRPFPHVYGRRALPVPEEYAAKANAVIYYQDGRREYAFAETGWGPTERNVYYMPDMATAQAIAAAVHASGEVLSAGPVTTATVPYGVCVTWLTSETSEE